MEIAIIFAVLILSLVLTIPVPFAFGVAAGVAALLYHQSFGFIPDYAFQGVNSFPMLAVPFFLLAGDLMREGRTSDVLIGLFDAVAGRIKGGLGGVTAISSMFFGTVTGSSVATVSAIGSIMIPKMVEHGYDRRYATALVGVSGFLGMLIPPSIPLIIFGLVNGTSVGALFLGSITPGVLLTIAYVTVNRLIFSRWFTSPAEVALPVDKTPGSELRHVGRTTLRAFPALLMPILILGGIYGGIFTPTEAAAVASVYALIVGLFIYRGLKWRQLRGLFTDTALTSAVLLLILAFATAFNRSLAGQGIPLTIAEFVSSITQNRYLVMLLLNVVLLLLGMFFDMYAVIILLSPLVMPLAKLVGIHPVHLGVIFVFNMEVGMVTPPFAVNLFMAARIGKVGILEVMKPVSRFLFFACLPVLFLSAYVPELVLWLPRLVFGAKMG